MITTRSHGFRLLLVVMMATVVLSACDEEDPPETRVTTVTVSGGNGQEGTVAEELPLPIALLAVDGQDRPVAGARVEWMVSTGGGSIEPISDVTDQDGVGQATWTLGTGAGQQAASAMVGTASVSFTATAVAGPAVSLTIVPEAIALDAIGATEEVSAVGEDAHGNTIEGRAPQWTSLDEDVVTVDADGVVTAVGPGEAQVRGTLDEASAEADVVVEPVVASILVTPDSPELAALDDEVQMQAGARDRNGNAIATPAEEFSWSSTDEDVAAVSETGLVTAVSNGTAMIQATLGEVTGGTEVTVDQVAVSLDVTPATDTLTTSSPTRQLEATGTDANDHPIASPDVMWSTSDDDIATVSASGVVTAESNGVAVIKGTSGTAADSAIITVRLNTAPVAYADTFGAELDTDLEVPSAEGVLANDTLGIPAATVESFGGGDLDGNVTEYDAGDTATFGTGGSIQLNANGSLDFTPSAGFTGEFTFRYRAGNSAGESDAEVTIQVGVGPSAEDDAYVMVEGESLEIEEPGLLDNDDIGFPEGAVASFGGGSLGGTVTRYDVGTPLAFGIGGFIQVNEDGSFTFTPANGFTGTFTFRYRLANSAVSSDATVTIEVQPAT
jgi:hypothetical protein